jgi:hypothetical protein|tara:strand:- start:3113 stop:3817 length:705 start_codon:yes stop_codon:yes gene_type:complete
MTSSDTICQFVDTIIDEYSINKKKIRVDFFKYFQSEDIDRKTINEYASNYIHQVTNVLEELEGALDGDEVLSEAYSHFNKPELREFKSLLDRFVSGVEQYKESKRIVRRKKQKTPDQLVKGLHLRDKPFIIEGKKYIPVPTEKIIGSKSIFLFNTTTHDLLFITGNSLTCKGAKILDYNNSSGIKKSKKVIETLDRVLTMKPCNCCEIFNQLPNKKRPVPKTVSPNFILLKVIP